MKDLLKIDQTVGRDSIKALVEGEVLLPETKPEIVKVLTVDGDVEVTSSKLVKDKIIVNGVVRFKIMYNSNDENQVIHSLDASTDFREEIEIEGINDQMTAELKTYIEHIDYELVNEAKIEVKTVLEIEGKVKTSSSIDIVKDISGERGLQVLKEKIKYKEIIGANSTSALVKEAFELENEMPDILDVLRTDAKVIEKETKVVDDKVIVAGIVQCGIMYIGDDDNNRVNYMNHEIPFTQFVEMTGVLKDMNCSLSLKLDDINYDVKEDIEGSIRIIDVEALIKIDARVYEYKDKEVTIDTYSTNKKLDVNKQEILITENIKHMLSESVVKGVINTSEENIKVNDVYHINGKSIITDYRTVEGKLIIEGILDLSMVFNDKSLEPVKVMNYQIPFKNYSDMEEVVDSEIEIEIDNIIKDIKYEKVNDTEIEVEALTQNNINVNRIKKLSIVTKAVETEEEIDLNSRPSIIIYIVQKDDTLWDIAKRYNTTTEELIETNEILSPENIMPGEKLIIEKNVDFEI